MAKIQVVITPEGQVAFTVAEGEYNSAKAEIEAMINSLQLAGIEFSEIGEVERHRHDHAHLDQHVHQH